VPFFLLPTESAGALPIYPLTPCDLFFFAWTSWLTVHAVHCMRPPFPPSSSIPMPTSPPVLKAGLSHVQRFAIDAAQTSRFVHFLSLFLTAIASGSPSPPAQYPSDVLSPLIKLEFFFTIDLLFCLGGVVSRAGLVQWVLWPVDSKPPTSSSPF